MFFSPIDFKNIISSKTKLVSLVHISNTLGSINPINEVVKICNSNNIISVIDGAQAARFMVDLCEILSDMRRMSL